MKNKKFIGMRNMVLLWLRLFIWDLIVTAIFILMFPIVYPLSWMIRCVVWVFNDLSMKDTSRTLISDFDMMIVKAFTPKAMSIDFLLSRNYRLNLLKKI